MLFSLTEQKTSNKYFITLLLSWIYRKRELSYGEKDTMRSYTFLVGDLVEFNISTDRRDHLQRSSNLKILPETFLTAAEQRETVSMT